MQSETSNEVTLLKEELRNERELRADLEAKLL